MLKSLWKGLRRVDASGGTSKSKHTSGEEKSASSWKGVSLRFLATLWTKVQCRNLASDIQLFVTQQPLSDQQVPPGTTIALLDQAEIGICIGRTVDGRTVTFELSQVTAKSRRDWTLEDVATYVTNPVADCSGGSFIDSVDRKARGKKFSGDHVICSPHVRFRDLVQTLCQQYDAKSLHKRFVWISTFGLEPGMLQTCTDSQLPFHFVNQVYSAQEQFDQRIVYIESWDRLESLLKNSLVLLEMYGNIYSHSFVQVLSPSKTKAGFLRDLFSCSKTALSAVEEFTLESTTDKLASAIINFANANLGGVKAFDKAMRNHIREIIATVVREGVQSERVALTCTQRNTEDDLASLAQLLNEAATLLAELGDTTVAIKYNQEALAICSRFPGLYQTPLYNRAKGDVQNLLSGTQKNRGFPRARPRNRSEEEEEVGPLGIEEPASMDYAYYSSDISSKLDGDFLTWLRLDCEGEFVDIDWDLDWDLELDSEGSRDSFHSWDSDEDHQD